MIGQSAVAAMMAVVLAVGAPADPVSQREHAAQALAQSTRAAALAAADTTQVGPDGGETPADPVVLATDELFPGEPVEIDVEGADASVGFSGFEVDESLDITVTELSDQVIGSAESETGGIAVSEVIDVDAETADGDAVTDFPADAEIEKIDGVEVVTEVTPGVELEFAVDEKAVEGLDPSSLRILTRENPGEPWAEIPSYYDADAGVVKGEIDHLSQFVVIGEPFTPPPGPRIVLDPDDNVGHTTGPGGPLTELPVNVRLANELAVRLAAGCRADVLVTRTVATPDFVSRDVRAGMAAAHDPDLMLTVAFNAFVGHAWGTEPEGGSLVFSRGGAADNALQGSLVAELPGYTGRPAEAAGSEFYPYAEFDGIADALAQIETLFIDHNYDRPVIETAFEHITSGVFTGMGKFLETKGFDCTDPETGGWPKRPSAAQLKMWRNLGYQNFQTYGADPVSFSTGNLVEDEPLFALTGPGSQVTDVKLVYNAQDGRVGRVGAGWNFASLWHAQRFDDGSVLVVRGDGASFVFEPDGTGGYVAEEGLTLTLIESGGGKLTLTDRSGEERVFDAADVDGIGEQVSHTDAAGNTTTYGYATPDENDGFVPLASIIDEAGQTIAVGHDETGRISSFTHPDGRVWQLGYDDAGDLVRIGLPGGRERTFTYDDEHRLLTAVNAAGVTYLVNEYDEAGRVVRQLDADENVRTFSYDLAADGSGATTYTDNEGNQTVFAFDERARITSITDAAGNTAEYSYDDGNRVTEHTDENGHAWAYEYDSAGNLVRETDPEGAVVTYTYTPTGQVASVTDEGGEDGALRTTVIEYGTNDLPVKITRADGTGLSWTYTPAGDVATSVDAAGETTTHTYDARGNLTAQTDPLGRVTRYAYDAGNRVVTVTDPAGGVTTVQWDDADRVVSQTDAEGAVTRFAYDALDHLTSRTTADGAVTRYAWDDLSRMVTTTDPTGAVTKYEYNREDELVRTTDPLGRVISMTLDDLYRPVRVTDAAGNKWNGVYDPAGNLTEVTDPNGKTTTYAYDALGRQTTVTDPLGATTTTHYDAVGRVTKETDANGHSVSYRYDPLDQIVAVSDAAGFTATTEYDAVGRVTKEIDRRGKATTYAYDDAGQLTGWQGPAGAAGSVTYDPNGNPLTQVDALGHTTTFTYDKVGRTLTQTDPNGRTATTAYDAVGRPISVTDAKGHVTATAYDPAGRPVSVTDPMGAVSRTGYDAAGQPVSVTDPRGNVTRYEYAPTGQLAAVIEGFVAAPAPAGTDVNVTTRYEHTATGLLAKITNANGAVTSYAHDAAGRVIKETNPLGKVTTYEYDLAGYLTAETNPLGHTTRHTYTPRGDVAETAYHDGTRVRFEYDAAQNPIVMTDALGITGWIYDDAGQVTSTTDAAGQTVRYTYDAEGQRTAVVAGGGTVSTEYDPAGNPVRTVSPWGQMVFGYDPAGNPTSITRSNGVTSQYSYDAADRLTKLVHTSPGAELGCDLEGQELELGVDLNVADLIDLDLCLTVDIDLPVLTGLDLGDAITLDYGYDAAGNVVSTSRVDGSGPKVEHAYAYDRLNRVVGDTATTTTAPLIEVGVNGPVLQLTAPTVNTVVDEFRWDRAGNLTGITSTDAPALPVTTTRTFNAANQLTLETVAKPGLLGLVDALLFGNSTRFEYDAAGQRTAQYTGLTKTASYSYTPTGQVATVTGSGRELSFGYDGLGRALTETTSSLLSAQTLTRVFDGLTPIGGVNEQSGSVISVVRGPSGEAVLQHTDTALVDESSWLLADRLGSVVGQTGGSRITGTARYSLFGEPTFDTVGWDAVPGFTGELVDEPTGLVAFHARGYDPASKTWLSPDPWQGTVTAPGTQNRYGYVLGNPATYVDHLGNRPVIPDGGGGTARIGAAARARANAAEWAAANAADRRERAQMLNRVNATRQAEGRHPIQTLATQNGMLDGKPGIAHNPQRKSAEYISNQHEQTPWGAIQAAARSTPASIVSAISSGLSALAGFAALAILPIPGVNAVVVPALAITSIVLGAVSTAIDCVAYPGSFSCGLGVVSLAVGPAVGAFGRVFRAASGTIRLLKQAANAGLLPAGLATTIGGVPSLWE